MKLGLFSINSHVCADPEVSARVARLAEELGYDSVWAGEHVVVPSPRDAQSPMEPGEPILDPLTALAFIAAHTERIRLASGVIVLPQRNPLVLAKQVASVDVLSGGRLILGVGVGYLRAELQAVGVPAERGLLTVEYLQAMRSLWEDEAPAFHGRQVDFEGVDAHPRPVQRPLPVVMGGHSAVAHRRAATMADGWYGFMLKLPQAAQQIETLRREMERSGRELEITVTPAHRLDAEIVAAYAKLGVHRLVVTPRPELSEKELLEFVRGNATIVT
jgi:probable F420-dependent oxidoreductase